MVTGVVEGTDPEFEVKIHLAIGVEDCVTVLVGAADWFIGIERGHWLQGVWRGGCRGHRDQCLL